MAWYLGHILIDSSYEKILWKCCVRFQNLFSLLKHVHSFVMFLWNLNMFEMVLVHHICSPTLTYLLLC
jgi:hypothetical protein